MKRVYPLRIAVLVLIFCFATCGVVSSTGAKYITAASLPAAAQVAEFNIQVNGSGNIAAAGFGGTVPSIIGTGLGTLWQPATRSDGATATYNGDGNLIPNVAHNPTGTLLISTDNGTLIAPGTGGRINFSVTNASEVRVKITIEAGSAGITGIPTARIEYSADNSTWKELANINDVWNSSYVKEVELGPGESIAATDAELSLYWKWIFYRDGTQDAADTALGIAAVTTPGQLSIPLKITAVQMN